MTMTVWGRGLLIWGLIAFMAATAPALLLLVLPESAGDGFFGLLAILLSLSVAPLAAIVAVSGAVLLLVAFFRRDGA